MIPSQDLDKKRRAVADCIREFQLDPNPAITEEVMAYEGFPQRSSKKLACLIMAYKREARTTKLKQVSDQPAGIIRNLREDGFLFQGDGNGRFCYRNEQGETCRKVTGFNTPKLILRGRIKSIMEKSIAACLSAIEVYNKPRFHYREETFSILMVNAWELALKAKILLDNDNQICSIQATRSDGTVKQNRSGNALTIDAQKAMNLLAAENQLDTRCRENIQLLIEIRDNAIHYFNKGPQFSRKVQEIGIASLRNYMTAANEWFEIDLAEHDFYMMPMAFIYPVDLVGVSVDSSEAEMENMLAYFHEVERQYAGDEMTPYSVTLRIETRFMKVTAEESALRVQYTDDPDAPAIRVTEESVIERKYPLTYHDLVDKLRGRYTDFKQNREFYALKRDLEDQEKHGTRYCRVRYLDVSRTTGSKKKYYSTEILKEFDKHYTKK
jgi:hypothetical protein